MKKSEMLNFSYQLQIAELIRASHKELCELEDHEQVPAEKRQREISAFNVLKI